MIHTLQTAMNFKKTVVGVHITVSKPLNEKSRNGVFFAMKSNIVQTIVEKLKVMNDRLLIF